jgi:outer membrane lipoprotein carrier protein
MKRFVLFLPLFVISFSGPAFARPRQRSSRPNAREISRAIAAHYRRAKTLEAVFLETYRAGENDLRVESGRVYFRSPGLMRWDYEAPSKKLFLTDGRYAWFYVPANHTASRTPMRKSADWRTPFALLTGKADLGKLCSALSVVPNPGGPGAPPPGHVVVDCQPKKHEDFVDAQIEVDRSSKIVRVTVEQAGGITTEVQFGNWKENVPLAKSLFEFSPPRGVAIVDQEALAGVGP